MGESKRSLLCKQPLCSQAVMSPLFCLAHFSSISHSRHFEPFTVVPTASADTGRAEKPGGWVVHDGMKVLPRALGNRTNHEGGGMDLNLCIARCVYMYVHAQLERCFYPCSRRLWCCRLPVLLSVAVPSYVTPP